VSRLVGPSLSTRQLAARADVPLKVMRDLMAEEAKRGHVEQVGIDRWCATTLVRELCEGFEFVRPEAERAA
jgi:hypothetical protein